MDPIKEPFWTPLVGPPPEEFTTELTALLPSSDSVSERVSEDSQVFLMNAMQRFFKNPTFHWWCNPDLRPVSKELLQIYGYDENETLKKYQQDMENVLGGCLDCTESYQQDRRQFILK
ncbi:hypothetical protein BGZ83_009994 [Gryganskiella cystojenkinii]|nr:hypothetical protein BGZ83_009994 [Gryganskiella cystojenkinii]